LITGLACNENGGGKSTSTMRLLTREVCVSVCVCVCVVVVVGGGEAWKRICYVTTSLSVFLHNLKALDCCRARCGSRLPKPVTAICRRPSPKQQRQKAGRVAPSSSPQVLSTGAPLGWNTISHNWCGRQPTGTAAVPLLIDEECTCAMRGRWWHTATCTGERGRGERERYEN
jgi:hypothetical protein